MADLKKFMLVAIAEAETSLRQGDCGFGAVIFSGHEIVAKTHDTEKTDGDPTAHAELKAIRQAAAKLGPDLSGCGIVTTHEPCPMCSTAIVWAGIGTVAFGCSIHSAIQQGRKRIDLPCGEIFEPANHDVDLHAGVSQSRCETLYNSEVRNQVNMLRDADKNSLCQLADKLKLKRQKWVRQQNLQTESTNEDVLNKGYRALLLKLGIPPDEAPIIDKDKKQLVFASKNFCPTLEACKILQLDTRFVCRHLTEGPTEALLKEIDPRLRFRRDYTTLRPNGTYCKETIFLVP
jgi:tRNA(adenine34) deaminase